MLVHMQDQCKINATSKGEGWSAMAMVMVNGQGLTRLPLAISYASLPLHPSGLKGSHGVHTAIVISGEAYC